MKTLELSLGFVWLQSGLNYYANCNDYYFYNLICLLLDSFGGDNGWWNLFADLLSLSGFWESNGISLRQQKSLTPFCTALSLWAKCATFRGMFHSLEKPFNEITLRAISLNVWCKSEVGKDSMFVNYVLITTMEISASFLILQQSNPKFVIISVPKK